MNRERVAHRFIAPDAKLRRDAHIHDLANLCSATIADNMNVAERSVCIPGVFTKSNAH